MGKMGNVAFINSFIGEVRKTQKDFTAIRKKRAENARKDELFKLQKKNYESQIKVREQKGEITPVDAKSIVAEFKDYTSMLTNESKLQDSLLDNAQSDNMNKQKKLQSITRQLMPTLKIMTNEQGQISSQMTFAPGKVKEATASEKFNQGFAQAEAGEISFEALEKGFPNKRKVIKEQRILGLPEKSQRLLAQINREILTDEKRINAENKKKKEDARRGETPQLIMPDPEIVIQEFLEEIVENKEQAERSGHDVNKILDILGVTEQEILDNRLDDELEPESSFLEKISKATELFTTLGRIKRLSGE